MKYGETFDFSMETFGRLVDQGKLQRDTVPTLSNIVTLVLTICHISYLANHLYTTVRHSDKTPLMSALLRGPPASGKTAIVAKVAVLSGFPFVRMISTDEMIGYSKFAKCSLIHKIFLETPTNRHFPSSLSTTSSESSTPYTSDRASPT